MAPDSVVSCIPLSWTSCSKSYVSGTTDSWLTSAYRDTMLIVGGMNFVLMLPGAVLVKTRLPPHRPPPWSDMKRPWKDTRYTFHVIGAMLFGMK